MEVANNCQFIPDVKTFEKVGFKKTKSDLTLPEGWNLKPDEEGNWGNILDNKNRYRGFYQCNSGTLTIVTLVTRYTIEGCHTLTNTFFSPVRIFVSDQGTFYFNVGKCAFDDISRMTDLQLLAKTHLDGKHPSWEDPAMYWD